MATGVRPETWFPVTPPPNGHPDHAPSKDIGIDAMPHQSQGKNGNKKVGLKKERKKRGYKGRIYLDATFEHTPKRRTPKPTEPERVVPLQPKRKNAKRKLDKSTIMISKEVITPLIAEKSFRRSNLNEPTSFKRSKFNMPAKRVLDFNLDYQLEVENSSNLVPQVCAPESSSSGNSLLNMCRRALLRLRCHCCSCRIGKVKPQFPKEYKRLRTMLRIEKSRKQRQMSPLLQRTNIHDLSVGGDTIKVMDKQTSLVNMMKEKMTNVKTDENGAVTKERKKNKKKKLASGSQRSRSLYDIHMKTQLEVIVDEESKKVCKLLKHRDDDGNDPIKKEDEAKQRWWDEQRHELSRKALVFILVMRKLLGNRDFSPWKGSIVDSVVGVFLTQNVSDNLSSSAFMSMVARYPAKPPSEDRKLYIEYGSSSENQQDDSQEPIASCNPPDQHIDCLKSSAKKQKMEKGKGKRDININWDDLRTTYSRQSHGKQRNPDKADSVNWDAVRKADVSEVAKVIEKRGQQNVMAEYIKSFLDRVVEDHGSIDLEWLTKVPPLKVKEYLLSIYGIGLKSVECLRLLTLHHHAFPVDVNVGRIEVRLGWVPLQPLPDSVHFHLLLNYPPMNKIQDYLWPRLCHLSQATLYKLHCLLITFGKVFCTKTNPHCGECPLSEACKYYASKRESSIPSLSWLKKKDAKNIVKKLRNGKPSTLVVGPMIKRSPGLRFMDRNCEPIIEEPSSPEQQVPSVIDIEDLIMDDGAPDDITFIDLTKLVNYSEKVHDASGPIFNLSPGLASNAKPELKLIARRRTEHQVYEVPDSHSLLQGLPRREIGDICPYLLAICPQDGRCQKNHLPVLGTLLIPVRTAMKGNFPLNGTYFQENERPINVPRNVVLKLSKKTLYCGTSTTSIVKGLRMEHIQHCFKEGYICIRAFNRGTKKPKRLPEMFHQRPRSTPKKKVEEHVKVNGYVFYTRKKKKKN